MNTLHFRQFKWGTAQFWKIEEDSMLQVMFIRILGFNMLYWILMTGKILVEKIVQWPVALSGGMRES